MVAVCAPAGDVQKQVELGGSGVEFGHRGRGWCA
jgi:hypothetical protein